MSTGQVWTTKTLLSKKWLCNLYWSPYGVSLSIALWQILAHLDPKSNAILALYVGSSLFTLCNIVAIVKCFNKHQLPSMVWPLLSVVYQFMSSQELVFSYNVTSIHLFDLITLISLAMLALSWFKRVAQHHEKQSLSR